MNLATLLVLASIANQGQSISDKISNEEVIKLAPEGTPEHTIFTATGRNPFDLLEKVNSLQEETPVPESNSDAIKNTTDLVGKMAEAFTGEELATIVLYAMLSVD